MKISYEAKNVNDMWKEGLELRANQWEQCEIKTCILAHRENVKRQNVKKAMTLRLHKII
jgi:hypothetical protein